MTDKIDHSNYTDNALAAAALEAFHKEAGTSNHPPGQHDPFPQQLFYMLKQTEQEGLAHIVGWAPHGRSFSVLKRKEFVESVLPKFFKQTKHSSFQRQLALYGFKRVTQGPDRGSYYHPCFLRISAVYCRNITRTKIKNEGPRKKSSPENEPNFYKMPKLGDAVKMEELKRHFAAEIYNDQKAKQSPMVGFSTLPDGMRSNFFPDVTRQRGSNSISELRYQISCDSQQISQLLRHHLRRHRCQNQVSLNSLKISLLHSGTDLVPREKSLLQSTNSLGLLGDHIKLAKQQQVQQISPKFRPFPIQKHQSAYPEELQDCMSALLHKDFRY